MENSFCYCFKKMKPFLIVPNVHTPLHTVQLEAIAYAPPFVLVVNSGLPGF